VGPAVALLAAGVVLAACRSSGGGIELAAAEFGTVTEVVEAPANVEARATSALTATGDGTLAAVYVRDGQRVDAGTIVARISSPQAQARLRSARSQLAQAEAAVPTAPQRIDVSGTQAQADATARGAFAAARTAAGQIPEPRLREVTLAWIVAAERQYALAQAQAQAAVTAINTGIGSLTAALGSLTAAQRTQALAAVGAAQQAVDALTIRTPIAGTVQLGGSAAASDAGGGAAALGSALDQLPPDVRDQATAALGGDLAGAGPAAQVRTTGPVTVGMPVATGTPVATIVDTSALSLVAEVDETDVLLVRPGVPATAELDAAPGARYPATVRAVDLTPTSSPRGGVSYRVRLSLGRGRLADGRRAPSPRPGMSAVADLQVRVARDAVTVPASAVIRVENQDAVWLVDGGKARRQPVTLGAQGADVVQVLTGLHEGQRVVVRGADKVSDGQDVP
jgi:multidrug efflux pump subunit AcrA (membrane-fusion protein)